LKNSVPSVRTGTGTERTGTEILWFLLWKRTDRFLKFGNRNFIGTEELTRSVRVEPNAQAYSKVLFIANAVPWAAGEVMTLLPHDNGTCGLCIIKGDDITLSDS
jgi:hypothetical protein